MPPGPSLELVYRAEAGEEANTQSARDRAIGIVCERLRAFTGVEGEVRALGGQVRVLLPQGEDADRSGHLAGLIGATGQVYFYDWEPNLIGPERVLGGLPGTMPPVRAKRRAERGDTLGRRGVVLKVPVGTAIVSEHPTGPAGVPITAAGPGWFALRDRFALSADEITGPREESDETGRPNVTFGFTPKGRATFQQLTREVAYRGRARAIGPVDSEEAEGLSGHIALVFDREIKTRPIIDFTQNPNGIDGRTGAQISGGFASAQEARDLATILKIGALPINLALVRRTSR